MNKGLILLICLLATVFVSPSTGNTETLPLLSLEFPPWNYQEKESGKIVGASVEIVRDIFHRIGYEVEIDILPWKRSQIETAKGKYAGVFTLTKSPTRLKHFYYSAPISTLTEVFFKRKDRNITWNTLEDLKGQTVGIVGGYNYSDQFKKAREAKYFKIDEVSNVQPDYLNLLKLARGRIDLFISFIGLGSHIIKSNPEMLSGLDYIEKPIGKPRLFYFAFSKKWPNALELRDKFNAELRTYALQGNLDKIHKEYGMVILFDESVDGKFRGFQEHYKWIDNKEN